jgi:hypothetical protein
LLGSREQSFSAQDLKDEIPHGHTRLSRVRLQNPVLLTREIDR